MLENYHVDQFGVLHQTDFKPIEYDDEYMARRS